MFIKDSETQISVYTRFQELEQTATKNSRVPWGLCNCMPIVVGIESSLHKYRPRCSLDDSVWHVLAIFSRYNYVGTCARYNIIYVQRMQAWQNVTNRHLSRCCHKLAMNNLPGDLSRGCLFLPLVTASVVW